VKAGIEGWGDAGYRSIWQLHECLLAESYLLARRTSDALSVAEAALQSCLRTGSRHAESVARCLFGDIALAIEPRDLTKAERFYQEAIEVARSQSAKSWELRGATRLARLWQGQGKTAEARDLLAPVYGWFTEGFDTADLKEAKALLDELSVS
jgi:predicted ATPase